MNREFCEVLSRFLILSHIFDNVDIIILTDLSILARLKMLYLEKTKYSIYFQKQKYYLDKKWIYHDCFINNLFGSQLKQLF